VLPSAEYSIVAPRIPNPKMLSTNWFEFHTHILSSRQTRSNSYWIQVGCGPVPLLSHMSVPVVECPSLAFNPEPSTVFSGPIPASCELEAVAFTFVIG
jgi:hypothetical protein